MTKTPTPAQSADLEISKKQIDFFVKSMKQLWDGRKLVTEREAHCIAVLSIMRTAKEFKVKEQIPFALTLYSLFLGAYSDSREIRTIPQNPDQSPTIH